MTVINRQRACRVPRVDLTEFLERLIREAPADGASSVAVCLVSDRRMREYNRQFRGRDATTDVLSFACEPVPGVDEQPHLGDIVISVPAAERQARRARHALGRELKILALHGYLHLLGHDHETDDGTMQRLERSLRGRLLRGRHE